MEKVKEIPIDKQLDLLPQLIDFSRSFEHFSILTSNQYPDPYGRYELLAAFGGYRLFSFPDKAFDNLKQVHQETPTWLFGHLGYELKDQIEDLSSRHKANFDFGEMAFFEPAYLVLQARGGEKLELYCNFEVDPQPLLKWSENFGQAVTFTFEAIPKMKPLMSKAEYLETLEELKAEIQYGNVYELNYCQSFQAEKVELDPYALFHQLNQRSPMPFACFYKKQDDFLIGASPERYLCKREEQLYSQPIKGTYPRGKTEAEDERLKQELKADLKEQTENVMIVDLVRNDLSRTAAKSSVKVEELFGVYTFPQVHQLISTVSSKLKEGIHFTDALKNSFPMGSMTGAPKVSAMKLIDKNEASRRELYSGSVGYIDPYGSFDFNVVIRSLFYQAQRKFLSVSVGGAITDQSVPEKEYQECLLKAKAIFEQQKS
ncbi:MAG: anthranilate synthase component I family protein [Vicingaceae bacterium]